MTTANVTGRRPGRPRKNVIASGPVPQAPTKDAVKPVREVSDFGKEIKTFKKDALVRAYVNLTRKLFRDGQFDEAAGIGRLLHKRLGELRAKSNAGSTLH